MYKKIHDWDMTLKIIIDYFSLACVAEGKIPIYAYIPVAVILQCYWLSNLYPRQKAVTSNHLCAHHVLCIGRCFLK